MSAPTASRSHSPAAIRAARQASGLTREAAAFAAGISVAALRDAEKGRDSRGSTLHALASVYGVSIDAFFVHDVDATPGCSGRGENHEGPDPRSLPGDVVGVEAQGG